MEGSEYVKKHKEETSSGKREEKEKVGGGSE
jgi:hypothetical protein